VVYLTDQLGRCFNILYRDRVNRSAAKSQPAKHCLRESHYGEQ